MANNRIRFNNAGFAAVRRAPKVRQKLEEMAQKIADGCNENVSDGGYKTSSVQGAAKPSGRWRTTVITATAEAQRDNAQNQTLARNLDRARDA